MKPKASRYRLLVEHANEAILVVQNGRAAFVNPKGAALFGCSRGEPVSQPFTGFIHEDHRALVKERHEKRLQGESLPETYSFKIITGSGEVKWVELKVTLVTWKNKPATLCFFTDITEQRRAEATLLESEQLFKTVAERSPNMIFIVRQGRIVYHNPISEKTLRYTWEELCEPEFDFFTLLAPESREAAAASFKNHMSGLDIGPVEYTLVGKDGRRVYTVINTKLIDYKGERAILGVVTDITELKRFALELKQAKERLEHRARKRTVELERHKKSLEKLNTALSVMLEVQEKNKQTLEDKVLFNIEELIKPLVKELKNSALDNNQAALLNALESSLKDIASPFSRALMTKFKHLTRTEVRVANLVKAGKSTKEIAGLLNSTPRTVDFHRQNIRKKLGLVNRRTNLASHLMSLTE